MSTLTTNCAGIILRVAVAVILFAHSIPVLFNGGVQAFGEGYLNQQGFAPFGVPLAWAIKLSHIICAVLLLLNRFVWPAVICTVLILVVGIIMVHAASGWFVVGNGTNGVEFNFLLIMVLLAIGLMKREVPEKQPGKH